MKNTGKSNTVEYIYFRFVAWNSIHLHNTSKLAVFGFDELLKRSLIQTVFYEKHFSIKQRSKNLKMGIATGQISVMRLQKSKILSKGNKK